MCFEKGQVESMSFVYAIGDLHGKYDLLTEVMNYIDLEEKENTLYFLGDYIDRGEKSLETITYVRDLWENKPLQVFPLMGNHELMLLDDLESRGFQEDGYRRILSLLLEEHRGLVDFSKGNLVEKFRSLQALFYEKQGGLVEWIENLPLYQETKWQIFAHAGIEEEENWKVVTDPNTFLWSRKCNTGYFHKDIIVGHTPTKVITKDSGFNEILWDGKSHFYIDGHAFEVNRLQVLRFDTETEEYSYLEDETKTFLPVQPYDFEKIETS